MSRSLLRIVSALAVLGSAVPAFAQVPALSVSGSKTADYLQQWAAEYLWPCK
jgi:hypothetical protein